MNIWSHEFLEDFSQEFVKYPLLWRRQFYSSRQKRTYVKKSNEKSVLMAMKKVCKWNINIKQVRDLCQVFRFQHAYKMTHLLNLFIRLDQEAWQALADAPPWMLWLRDEMETLPMFCNMIKVTRFQYELVNRMCQVITNIYEPTIDNIDVGGTKNTNNTNTDVSVILVKDCTTTYKIIVDKSTYSDNYSETVTANTGVPDSTNVTGVTDITNVTNATGVNEANVTGVTNGNDVTGVTSKRSGAIGREVTEKDVDCSSLEDLASQYKITLKDLQEIWQLMREMVVHKLEALAQGYSSDWCAMLSCEWRLADWLLLHDDHLPLYTEDDLHRLSTSQLLQPLELVFYLVTLYQLEECPPQQKVVRWRRVLADYNKRRAGASLLLLQRWWHQLKRQTHGAFAALWRRTAYGQHASSAMPCHLHGAVAHRYPHVVTQRIPSWAELVRTGQVVAIHEVADNHEPIDESEVWRRGRGSSKPLPKGVDRAEHNTNEDVNDLVLIEKNIPTIDLECDSDESCDRLVIDTGSMDPIKKEPEDKIAKEYENTVINNSCVEVNSQILNIKSYKIPTTETPIQMATRSSGSIEKMNIGETNEGLSVGNTVTISLTPIETNPANGNVCPIQMNTEVENIAPSDINIESNENDAKINDHSLKVNTENKNTFPLETTAGANESSSQINTDGIKKENPSEINLGTIRSLQEVNKGEEQIGPVKTSNNSPNGEIVQVDTIMNENFKKNTHELDNKLPEVHTEHQNIMKMDQVINEHKESLSNTALVAKKHIIKIGTVKENIDNMNYQVNITKDLTKANKEYVMEMDARVKEVPKDAADPPVHSSISAIKAMAMDTTEGVTEEDVNMYTTNLDANTITDNVQYIDNAQEKRPENNILSILDKINPDDVQTELIFESDDESLDIADTRYSPAEINVDLPNTVNIENIGIPTRRMDVPIADILPTDVPIQECNLYENVNAEPIDSMDISISADDIMNITVEKPCTPLPKPTQCRLDMLIFEHYQRNNRKKEIISNHRKRNRVAINDSNSSDSEIDIIESDFSDEVSAKSFSRRASSDANVDSQTVDEKLIMDTVVSLVRVDDIDVWQKHSYLTHFRHMVTKSIKLSEVNLQHLLYPKCISENNEFNNYVTDTMTNGKRLHSVAFPDNPDYNTKLKKLPEHFKILNKDLLKLLKPMTIDLEKLEVEIKVKGYENDSDTIQAARKSGGRVTKKIELPDIEEVRRINKEILTAQVAPMTIDTKIQDAKEKDEEISMNIDIPITVDLKIENVQERDGELSMNIGVAIAGDSKIENVQEKDGEMTINRDIPIAIDSNPKETDEDITVDIDVPIAIDSKIQDEKERDGEMSKYIGVPNTVNPKIENEQEQDKELLMHIDASISIDSNAKEMDRHISMDVGVQIAIDSKIEDAKESHGDITMDMGIPITVDSKIEDCEERDGEMSMNVNVPIAIDSNAKERDENASIDTATPISISSQRTELSNNTNNELEFEVPPITPSVNKVTNKESNENETANEETPVQQEEPIPIDLDESIANSHKNKNATNSTRRKGQHQPNIGYLLCGGNKRDIVNCIGEKHERERGEHDAMLPTHDQLLHMLHDLQNHWRHSSVHCCAARRMRAQAAARRRVAKRAGRALAASTARAMHDRQHPEVCDCCCLHLLREPPPLSNSCSAALRRVAKLLHQRSAAGTHHDSNRHNLILFTSVIRAGLNLLLPSAASEKKKKTGRKTNKSKPTVDEPSNDNTYEGWIKEKNRIAKLYGFKPRRTGIHDSNEKVQQSPQIHPSPSVPMTPKQSEQSNEQKSTSPAPIIKPKTVRKQVSNQRSQPEANEAICQQNQPTTSTINISSKHSTEVSRSDDATLHTTNVPMTIETKINNSNSLTDVYPCLTAILSVPKGFIPVIPNNQLPESIDLTEDDCEIQPQTEMTSQSTPRLTSLSMPYATTQSMLEVTLQPTAESPVKDSKRYIIMKPLVGPSGTIVLTPAQEKKIFDKLTGLNPQQTSPTRLWKRIETTKFTKGVNQDEILKAAKQLDSKLTVKRAQGSLNDKQLTEKNRVKLLQKDKSKNTFFRTCTLLKVNEAITSIPDAEPQALAPVITNVRSLKEKGEPVSKDAGSNADVHKHYIGKTISNINILKNTISNVDVHSLKHIIGTMISKNATSNADVHSLNKHIGKTISKNAISNAVVSKNAITNVKMGSLKQKPKSKKAISNAKPVKAADYIVGRDPTSLNVLCLDASQPVWRIRGDYLVVTDTRQEFTEPELFTASPGAQAQLLLGEGGETRAALNAPEMVHMQDKVYQKILDSPLIYSQVTFVLSSPDQCRAMIVSPDKLSLYLYCLRTGRACAVGRLTFGPDTLRGLVCDNNEALSALVAQLNSTRDIIEIDSGPESD